MLAFVTTLRARALAQEWDYHVWLLERTLDSMLAQTNPDFVVVVVCHEIPNVRQRDHPKIKFLPINFPPPEQDFDDMCADKVLKLSAGIEWVIGAGCDHLMFSDADDLVNRNICAFVEARRDTDGFYNACELHYRYGGLFLRRHGPHAYSGPCAVFRADLLRFDQPPFQGRWIQMLISAGESRYLDILARKGRRVNTVAAVGHTLYCTLLAAERRHLLPLPFSGIVMIEHNDSTSHVAGGIGSRVWEGRPRHPKWRNTLSTIKQRLRLLPSLRPLSLSLYRDFTVLRPARVPPAYRSRGSIF